MGQKPWANDKATAGHSNCASSACRPRKGRPGHHGGTTPFSGPPQSLPQSQPSPQAELSPRMSLSSPGCSMWFSSPGRICSDSLVSSCPQNHSQRRSGSLPPAQSFSPARGRQRGARTRVRSSHRRQTHSNRTATDGRGLSCSSRTPSQGTAPTRHREMRGNRARVPAQPWNPPATCRDRSVWKGWAQGDRAPGNPTAETAPAGH